MHEKAKSNLRAAQLMVERDFFDSAASRAYYAVYQAGWAWLSANNEKPPRDDSGRRYWPHLSFAQKLFEWGALTDPEQRNDFDYLRSHRVKADYFVDPLNREEAQQVLELAFVLVRQLLDEFPDA